MSCTLLEGLLLQLSRPLILPLPSTLSALGSRATEVPAKILGGSVMGLRGPLRLAGVALLAGNVGHGVGAVRVCLDLRHLPGG